MPHLVFLARTVALLSMIACKAVVSVPGDEPGDDDPTLLLEDPPTPGELPSAEVLDLPRTVPPRGSPLAEASLYVAPDSSASGQADLWRESDPEGAALMEVIAAQPVGFWLGDWDADVTDTVDDVLDAADGQLVVFVLYNIPHRDCGSWSAGGAPDGDTYHDFVEAVADGARGRAAVAILEPDALGLITCLDAEGFVERQQTIESAVEVLSAAGFRVYIDAGASSWVDADQMAGRLLGSGILKAAGFSLNISHTDTTEDSVRYAEEIRAYLGDVHYVVDTTRNGLGPPDDGEWCNPPGRALGAPPTVESAVPGLDGLFWIKPPGESDGECNGGPPAGDWWPEYARGLADLADWIQIGF